MYKLKVMWPVFDIFSAYCNLFMFCIIMVFAIYYEITLFWAITLTIFMIHVMVNSSNHFAYRKKGREKFFEKIQS